MQHRIISILWLLSSALVGENAMFSADLQFRHHFISRELSITAGMSGPFPELSNWTSPPAEPEVS